jgi:hypothetical protein
LGLAYSSYTSGYIVRSIRRGNNEIQQGQDSIALDLGGQPVFFPFELRNQANLCTCIYIQRNGQYDIYRIAVEGGEEVQLTDTPGLDDGPEYTQDGRYIYLNSVRSGRMQIWRMRPDGSGQEQLTDDEYNNWFPHISPDGKWAVFLSYLPGEVEPSERPAARRLYLRMMPLDRGTLPVDGGNIKVLAYLYGGQGTMNVPSWSPDGKMLAFASNTVP